VRHSRLRAAARTIAAVAALFVPLALRPGLPPATAAETPKAGGQLTVLCPVDAIALDPQLETSAAGTRIYSNVLETLLVMNEQMQIVPGLASRYEVVSPTRVRFWLRPNVRFHDGTVLDAAAVRFSFERALRAQPPARWATVVSVPLAIEVVDALTLDAVTREPYGALLHVLAMAYTGIVSPAAVQRLGEAFSRAPVGTGPFRFVEWRTNTRVILERNPDYWGPRAFLDRVVFRVIPEEGTRILALQVGDADMVLQPSPAHLPTLRRDARFTVHEVNGLRVVYAAMNTTAPPLDDPLVRRALIHAVDRNALLTHVLEGAGLPVRSVIAPGVFGFKDMDLDRRYPYDPPRARALLAQAGWSPGTDGIMRKGGQRLALDWLSMRGTYLRDGELTEAVAAMLREAGVDVAVDFRDWAAVFKEVRGDPLSRHLFTWGFTSATGDADYSLDGMFHTRRPGTAVNNTRYSNPRVDSLLERARRSLDPAERSQLYGEVQDTLASDLVWIPLYTTKEIVLTRAKVRGFVVHPVDYYLALGRVWIDR
jgi:peptide/nickel transport system substrate-binding protein